jgi:hypothetical protein
MQLATKSVDENEPCRDCAGGSTSHLHRLALTCPSTGAVDVKLGPADVRFEPAAARVLCALRCTVRLPRRPRVRETPLALKCAARSSAVGCCLAGDVSDVLCSHYVCSQLCRRVAATSWRRRWRSQRRSKMQQACCWHHESRRETCHATAANRDTCHFRSALLRLRICVVQRPQVCVLSSVCAGRC